MPLELLVLADDLTGALEVGAKLGCPVRFDALEGGADTCMVIDTETRNLKPADAHARILDLLRQLPCRRVYKKTDSTLRGNIAAEFAALRDAYPDLPVAYIPAYPAMGRTVKSGQLYVHGVALQETPFSRDPLHPARTSAIADLLGNISAVTIHDGETDADVAAAVRNAGPLICGPAGLVDHLAAELGIRNPHPGLPPIENCLVVNGSMHELSLRQVNDAIRNGWHMAEPGEVRERIVDARWVILRLDDPCRNPQTIRDILEQVDVDALTVFGGDTAYGIVRALGERSISPIAEVLPGVPISRLTNTYLITKAGGFGAEDVLTEIRRRLAA